MIYQWGDFLISSEIAVPGLPSQVDGKGADVVIRCGRAGLAAPSRVFVAPAPGVARFEIRDGREILVDPEAGGDPALVGEVLVSRVLPALWYWRGLLPLHASLVRTPGGVVALAGESGAGKSSLAAALAAAGGELLADEPALLELRAGRVIAHAGPRRVKLMPDAAAASGYAGQVLGPAAGDKGKLLMAASPPSGMAAGPLRAIYVLGWAGVPGNAPRIHAPGGPGGALLLWRHCHHPRAVSRLGLEPEVFAACVAAARAVPVLHLDRARDLAGLAGSAAAVLGHVARARVAA